MYVMLIWVFALERERGISVLYFWTYFSHCILCPGIFRATGSFLCEAFVVFPSWIHFRIHLDIFQVRLWILPQTAHSIMQPSIFLL